MVEFRLPSARNDGEADEEPCAPQAISQGQRKDAIVNSVPSIAASIYTATAKTKGKLGVTILEDLLEFLRLRISACTVLLLLFPVDFVEKSLSLGTGASLSVFILPFKSSSGTSSASSSETTYSNPTINATPNVNPTTIAIILLISLAAARSGRSSSVTAARSIPAATKVRYAGAL